MRRASLFHSAVFRAALVYLCLFSAVVLALLGFIYWNTTASISRQIDATIDAEITGLAEQYDQRGTTGLLGAIERRLASADETRGLYLLTDRAFRPIVGNLSRWPDAKAESGGWITFPLENLDPEGADIKSGRARLFDFAGRYHLLVGNDTRERTRIAAVVGDSLLWGSVVIIGLSMLGALLLSRSLLGRIESINDTSREIMAGDLGRRVPLSGKNNEFDRLAGNLNDMLDQIERLLVGMKEVTDNIAHDLRSPIGRLRNRLDETLRSGGDEEVYRRTLTESIEDADALLKTFTALLDIAQAESGAPRRQFEPLDLGAVVRDVAELYEPLAEERGLELSVQASVQARLPGDRNLLFQALANLVDNAIKFSGPDGRVSVTLRLDAGAAEIAVADNGPGIPEEARERVCERFYRLEASRSTPGSGLGLSLVAAAARLHDGALRLEDNTPGLKAVLRLPLGPGDTLNGG